LSNHHGYGEVVSHDISHVGGNLHVLDHPGEEPAIVVMHGFPDDCHIYDRLIPQLAPRRVVTFDWLGYGRSGRRTQTAIEPGDRQCELRAVVDGLGLARVVLAGHDASGPEAVEFAVNQPDRVQHVFLFNTYYGRAASLHFPEMIALLANRELAGLADAMIRDENQRLWLLAYTAEAFGLTAGNPDGIGVRSVIPQFFGSADFPDALQEIRAWAAGLPHALDLQDARIVSGQLTTARTPFTLIFGARDKFLSPDLARHLTGLFPSSGLHLLGGASHWPQWDQPEIVADLMNTALTRPNA
jgi:pimeloyl-ACP methyl ester carboxylesterase